jgi:hypothetical protein
VSGFQIVHGNVGYPEKILSSCRNPKTLQKVQIRNAEPVVSDSGLMTGSGSGSTCLRSQKIGLEENVVVVAAAVAVVGPFDETVDA